MDNGTATQAHEKEQSQLSLAPSLFVHATSQSRATQMGSQPRYNKGVIVDQAIMHIYALR